MSRDDRVVEGAKLGGRFDIGDGHSVLGELSIRGTDTSLYLHDAEFFHVENEHTKCIRGTLHDHTKVTVLASSVRSSLGSATCAATEQPYEFNRIVVRCRLLSPHRR